MRPHVSSIQPIENTRRELPAVTLGSAYSEQTPFAIRRLLGVDVRVCLRKQALDFLRDRLASRVQTKIAFANMHLLSQVDAGSFGAATLEDFIVLNDGVGVDIASLLLFGTPFPDNLNGTDLVPTLLKTVSRETRVFLYGATAEIVARAADVLSSLCDVTICGTCDGYGVAVHPLRVAKYIRESSADIVLVALGNPGQESWIAENAGALGAPLVIGVGALFDIITGAYPRASAWIRHARLEWLYRTALEPQRLWSRYTVEAVSFLYRVLRQKREWAS